MRDLGAILMEGISADEIVSLDEIEALAVIDRPIIVGVGAGSVLAQFNRDDDVLQVEIAIAEGGGEGILAAFVDVVERAAIARSIRAIKWTVYARNCASPNPKLERVLTAMGFEILVEPVEHYWRQTSTNQSLLSRR